MATYTPKLNLKKPVGTELVSRSDMNDNYDKIDAGVVLSTDGEISNSLLIGTRASGSTIGEKSFAQGYNNKASGSYSHAEGINATASGSYSHAEGYNCTASKSYSHAEGINTTASGDPSHAEGGSTTASGRYSHAEGSETHATGQYSHAEGRSTTASGEDSHAEGYYTIASKKSQHVGGENNVEDPSGTSTTRGLYAEIIGNGTGTNARSNARALDWDGNEYLMGDLYVGCNADSTNGKKIIAFPEPPATNGTYVLKATVSSGTITYSWVAE